MKFGNTQIGGMSLGSIRIGGAKLGNTLVYQAGSPTPPTPVIEPVFYDRLIFDGTAYIDTDIIPPADCSFRCRFGNETLKARQSVFFAKAGSDSLGMQYSSSTTTTSRAIAVYYNASSTSGSKTLAFSTATYMFFLTPKRFGWSSNAYTITKGSSTPDQVLVLGSANSHSGQAYTGSMEIFRIYGSDAQNATTASDLYDNYTPLYTLRPCTYNGEPGMWCVETSKFYGNTAGAGALSVMNNS